MKVENEIIYNTEKSKYCSIAFIHSFMPLLEKAQEWAVCFPSVPSKGLFSAMVRLPEPRHHDSFVSQNASIFLLIYPPKHPLFRHFSMLILYLNYVSYELFLIDCTGCICQRWFQSLSLALKCPNIVRFHNSHFVPHSWSLIKHNACVLPCLKWYADAPISKSQGRKIKESSLSFFSVWSWILWSSCFSLFQCFLSPIHPRQQIKWSW